MATELPLQMEVGEAQSRLEELLDLFEAHPEHVLVLTRNGVPAAKMLSSRVENAETG